MIDESHNFRNDGGQRYQRLLEEVVKAGSQDQGADAVGDAGEHFSDRPAEPGYLMTEGREDAFQQSLGVGNIRTMMAAAQRQFKSWETEQAKQNRRDKAQLLENLGADFLRLLGGVSISRSAARSNVSTRTRWNVSGSFPNTNDPTIVIRRRTCGVSFLPRLGGTHRPIHAFRVSAQRIRHRPVEVTRLAETRKRQNFNQQDSERFPDWNDAHQLPETSGKLRPFLTLTLDRTVGKIDDLLGKIERTQIGSQSNADLEDADILPDEETRMKNLS